uniref:maestro heat-like repeat-containing protein family member 1 n=1 Tax=Pristiophorus japonicus TaxID=55135 RepID=UPI00398F5B22
MSVNVKTFSVALLKMTAEEGESCREKISKIILTLGRQHPEIIITSCHDYLCHRTMQTAPHSVVILESMVMIIKDNLDQLSHALAQKVIALAEIWMTMSAGAQAESQEAASNLLVTMSFRFRKEVVELMKKSLKQGILPHVYVVKTFTKLAVENVHGMVPLLKSILGTMIPVFVGVDQAELKSAFVSAVGSFAKSILIYLGNVEEAAEFNMTKDSFSSVFHSVYSLVLKVWLEKEASALTIPIVEALGYIIALLPKDTLEEELPRLFRSILSLYKKHPGHCSITECLCRVLEVAMEIKMKGLKAQVDNLLQSLHQQMCVLAGYDDHFAEKKILSCFEVLAPAYGDSIQKLILSQLKKTEQNTRVATLNVLKQLVISVSPQSERKAQVVAALKPLLQNKSSNLEKKLVAKVICVMAQQGYLEPEGGKAMVEFLIQECAAPIDSRTSVPSNNRPDQVTDEEVVTVCETVMYVITTAVKMEDILWPFLLQFVTTPQYTTASTTIYNCAAYLGKKKLQVGSERYFLTSSEDVNLPRAQALLTRLLVVSSCPYQGGGRGAAALRLMRVLSVNIHPATARGWEEELPSLVEELLTNSKESLVQREWEDKLLLVLSTSLNAIDDEEWTCQLANQIHSEIGIGNLSPQEKGFLYKSLGTVLRHTHAKQIKGQLSKMLVSVQHSESAEREGAALAIGFCAMTHFVETLSSLKEFAKSNHLKAKGSLNILGAKPDGNLAKSTLVLSYGNMAFYAPVELVLSTVETHILPAVFNLYTTTGQEKKSESGDATLKLSLIKAITQIASSLHANRQSVPLNLIRNKKLLTFMLDVIKAEPPELLQSPVRQLAMDACIQLIKLNIRTTRADTCQLIQACLTSTFSVLPPQLDNAKDMNGDTKVVATLYTQTMSSLEELLKQLLLQDLTPEGLQVILNQVEVWIISGEAHERESAMNMNLQLLTFYRQQLNVHHVAPANNLGTLIGRLMPRCADPSLPIRWMALDTLYTILAIQISYEGTDRDQQKEQLEILKAVREQLVNHDASVLFQTCYQIAEVTAKCLPHDQLTNLLFMSFKELSDQHLSCSSAAAALVKAIIERCGSELQDRVAEIIHMLRAQLESVAHQEVKRLVLRSIAILSSHNSSTVVSCLLTYPVPLDKYVSAMWQALAENTDCVMSTMGELLDILNNQLPFPVGRTDPGQTTKHWSQESLAAICGLQAMINEPESATAVTLLFPQIFSALLIYLNACTDVCLVSGLVPDDHFQQSEISSEPLTLESSDLCVNCAQTLKDLLERTKNQAVLNNMEQSGGWDQMMDLRTSHKGVVLLARAMGRFAGPCLTGIVTLLAAQILTLQDCRAVTVACFFSELLKSPLASQQQLTGILASRLRSCLLCGSPVIQLVCVRGLYNVRVHHDTKSLSESMIHTMITVLGIQENQAEVILFEVLSCLSKHLILSGASIIQPFLGKILATIQPLFEAESDKVRAEAFSVLGILAKCGIGGSKSSFCRQAHSNLVRLLLHLDGGSEEVTRACCSTLRLLLPLLGSVEASSMINDYEDAPTRNYVGFLTSISHQLAKDLPKQMTSYAQDCQSFFQGPQEQLRASANYLAFLLHQQSERVRLARKVSWWHRTCYRSPSSSQVVPPPVPTPLLSPELTPVLGPDHIALQSLTAPSPWPRCSCCTCPRSNQ